MQDVVREIVGRPVEVEMGIKHNGKTIWKNQILSISREARNADKDTINDLKNTIRTLFFSLGRKKGVETDEDRILDEKVVIPPPPSKPPHIMG